MTWCAGLALIGVLAGGGQPAGAARTVAGSWGRAIEVPGLAALDKGGYARVESVSCASAGNCAAGGDYSRHRPGPSAVKRSQGFVVVERHGVWGKAAGVPGLGALNKGGHAEVLSVSCGSAGNCAAGGTYSRQGEHGFVADERSGPPGTTTTAPARSRGSWSPRPASA